MLNYVYRYDVVAAVLSLAVFISFFRQKTVTTHITNSFVYYVIFVFVSSILDIVTVIVPKYMPDAPYWFLYLINILYLLTYNAIPLIFCFCIYYIAERNKTCSKRAFILMILPYCVSATLILTSCFTKAIFYFDESKIYLHGPYFMFLVVSSWVYVLVAIGFFIFRHKTFKLSQKVSLISYTLLGFISSVVQIFFQDQLITGFTLALAGFTIFLALENPADYINYEMQVFNRLAFRIIIQQAIETKKRLRIVGIYIPELRYLNDAIGVNHKLNILKGIAEFLESVIEKDLVFRITHNKIAVVLSSDDNKRSQQIEQIRERFNKPFKSGDIEISLTAMLDIVYCPKDSTNIDEVLDLLENSFNEGVEFEETGLIRANTDVLEKGNRERKLIQILSNAINEKDFEVVYQPIYSMKEHRFTTAEALLRLNNTELGYVSPEEFIPIAEKNGLILKIGNYVFKNVCKFLSESRIWEKGIQYIHVNLSVLQCMQEKLYEQLFEIMNSYNLDYSLINLEVTETTAIASSETLLDNMDKMKRRDMRFSLDDYGTGFSNTATLVQYPFNTVKIDKSMIWGAFQDEKAKIILKQTIAMIKDLDMDVVVEGIETEEQINLVKEMNCDYVQGYYYSLPIEANKFIEFVEKEN